jgi:hypothetical protein
VTTAAQHRYEQLRADREVVDSAAFRLRAERTPVLAGSRYIRQHWGTPV